MLQKVIDALEKECRKNGNSHMYEVISNHLISQCEANSQVLEIMAKAIDEKKSINGAIGKMRDEAKKRAVGGYGILTDEEGFEIVRKYFGIKKEKNEEERTAEIVSLTDFM